MNWYVRLLLCLKDFVRFEVEQVTRDLEQVAEWTNYKWTHLFVDELELEVPQRLHHVDRAILNHLAENALITE